MSGFSPFSLPQKEYRSIIIRIKVFELKILNLKISMRGRSQRIFQNMGAIIHCKRNAISFIRPSNLFLMLIVLEFSSFLRLKYSQIIHFLGELRYETKPIKNNVAGPCSKSFFQ